MVPGTLFLLFAYLAYLALGTGVFWALEGRAAEDSSRNFQRDKWELLQNFTCLDSHALDLLIRVRGERGRSRSVWGGIGERGVHRPEMGGSAPARERKPRERISRRAAELLHRGPTGARVWAWGAGGLGSG